MFFENINLPTLVVLIVILILMCVQLWYHFARMGKLLKYKKTDKLASDLSVSIIVCAQNELENLKKLVPQLLAQKYTDFEIVLVDDASWDGTTELIEEYQKEFSNIKGVFINAETKQKSIGKKFALTLGIKASKNDIILLTDADCMPTSDQWIMLMMQPYLTNPKVDAVLGYSPFVNKSNITALISNMENIFTGSLYLGYALAKKPYMAVGRNFSYKKTIFFKHKGFASHHHIAGGDDDLFLQQIATNENIGICLEPESFVYTIPKKTIGEWFKQKMRHNFAGKFYAANIQWKLGVLGISHLFLWLMVIVGLFIPSIAIIVLISIATFWFIKIIFMFFVFKVLKKQTYVAWIPLFDLAFVAYNIIFGCYRVFGKYNKW